MVGGYYIINSIIIHQSINILIRWLHNITVMCLITQFSAWPVIATPPNKYTNRDGCRIIGISTIMTRQRKTACTDYLLKATSILTIEYCCLKPLRRIRIQQDQTSNRCDNILQWVQIRVVIKYMRSKLLTYTIR